VALLPNPRVRGTFSLTEQENANLRVRADLKKIVAAQTPVRRVGTPEDIAHAIAFLTGEGAGFITGQVLYVTGGTVR